MATSTAQRTGIWIIAIVLTIGTLAGFIGMILAPQNDAADSAKLQDAYAKYQKESTEIQTKKDAQQAELDGQKDALSGQYFAQFNAFSARVGTFDKDAAQEKLVIEDVQAGSGETIGDDSTYAVYYIGWLPDGTVFDGSIENGALKSPFIARPNGTIAGWSEGAKGMKIGGVRQLTIPSAKGYGEAGQGSIPANTPLRFVLMPIKSLETIKDAELPQELLQSYGG